MRPDLQTEATATPAAIPLHLALRAEAAERDRDGGFPHAAFATLHARGLLTPARPSREATGDLFRLLAAVGRGDLSTGRIFEGHVNALDLIHRFGSPPQAREAERRAAGGEVLGVWNTDDPADPLRLDGDRLVGRKAFASGVDGLARAIVTVPSDEGRCMLLVPLNGLPVDRSWWRPLGMRASGSHVVDFTGLDIGREHRLGRPDDYVAQPWFSGGAARFAAVQVGGMHAVLDAAVEHLAGTGRAEAPHQAHRIARMGIAVETGYLWLERSARAWAEAEAAAGGGARPGAAGALVATANAARSAVEAAALCVLEEAERGVGAAGLIAPHPLERLIRDLRTYLRQPNPDGALSAFAAALVAGDWQPGEAPGPGGAR